MLLGDEKRAGQAKCWPLLVGAMLRRRLVQRALGRVSGQEMGTHGQGSHQAVVVRRRL